MKKIFNNFINLLLGFLIITAPCLLIYTAMKYDNKIKEQLKITQIIQATVISKMLSAYETERTSPSSLCIAKIITLQNNNRKRIVFTDDNTFLNVIVGQKYAFKINQNKIKLLQPEQL